MTASRQGGLGLLVALLCLAVVAAPAAATTLPFTTQPLEGSTFQGGDGNQTDAGGFVDWQSLGGVRHHSDFNPSDTAFTGGSEEDHPGGWGITTVNNGVGPPADNIRDMWLAVDQPGVDTFLYLAFSREGSGGTTFLAFELNRDSRLWDNDHDAATPPIPCRRTDDLDVFYTTHGNVPDVEVRRWVTTVADDTTDCARSGHFADAVAVTANVTAQGQLNATAIPSHLGGAFSATVPAGQFGEAALNLSDIAEKVFGDRCLAYSSVWMHSRASEEVTSQKKDFVGPVRLPVRSCTASGTKFWDGNNNHQRDPGEPGLPRFLIWADYNNDGHRDANEPFSITDDHGHYVIYDIHGEYTLRETLLPRRSSIPLRWVCSAPTTTIPNGRFHCAHGPFNVADTPNVEGQDFGNWFPAQLTLEKFIFPPTDLGRFDLLVNGTVELAGAGNGSRRTIGLPPGTYDISEQPAAGTDPADYVTQVDCQRDVSRHGRRRAGTAFEDLDLVAGARATCTFTNVRRGEPAIAIRKSGPASAIAGATLHYRLVVSNPGQVPIPADTIDVSDPACDSAPTLVEKREGSGPDTTPGTLDPQVDEWEYSCSRRTSAPGANCQDRTVTNTGTVTGTADGKDVTASDSISTVLLCPPPPRPEPEPKPPRPPDVPGPVVPSGPRPPEAGAAARAAFLFRQAARRCIGTHVPRLNFRGTRIARIRVYVNGQLRRRITMRALQRRVTPRVTLAPGRHRVRVRVVFQRGSGTPPVTLLRIIEVCARPAAGPRFTG